MRHRLLFPLSVITLLALTQSASANAGTPLVWAGMLHLAFGNFLIGLVEGTLLERLFGVTRKPAVGLMIAANYLSAWAGGLFIRSWIVDSLPLNLNNGWMWFWLMVPITFVITLILEWPFVAWGFRSKEHWIKVSVKASLVVQSVSYVLLFGFYWAASQTSLYTQMKIVAPSELPLLPEVTVYYLGPEDGHVYRRHLAAGPAEQVFALPQADQADRLLVQPNESNSSRWDLMVLGGKQLVPVLTNLSVRAAAEARYGKTTWMNFGPVPSMDDSPQSDWKFWAGFWAAEGLRATHEATGQRIRFSYETPFGEWFVRNAVLLPNDIVLFQLGRNQICAFDPATRKVALLWHGRGPVPVIEQTTPPAPVRTPGTPP